MLWLLETYLLQMDDLHADETTVQVLDAPKRYAWQKSYFWIRVTGIGPPIVRVDYAPNGAGAVAEGLLASFRQGYLQTDAYSGYNGIIARPDVTAVGCLAHARRRADAVLKARGRKSPCPEAELAFQALSFILPLYQIEKEIQGKSPEARLHRRQTGSQAVLDEFQ